MWHVVQWNSPFQTNQKTEQKQSEKRGSPWPGFINETKIIKGFGKSVLGGGMVSHRGGISLGVALCMDTVPSVAFSHAQLLFF